MMATAAHHAVGDISRDAPHLALIYGEDDDHWIGQWVAGAGFINARFPKASTRLLTAEERARYHGRGIEIAGRTIGQIRIPQEDS
jgi:hypothetical protein